MSLEYCAARFAVKMHSANPDRYTPYAPCQLPTVWATFRAHAKPEIGKEQQAEDTKEYDSAHLKLGN